MINYNIAAIFILLIGLISILWYLLLQRTMKITLYCFLMLYVLVGILLLMYGIEYLGLIILTIYLGAVIILLLFIIMLLDDKSIEEKNAVVPQKFSNLVIIISLILLLLVIIYLKFYFLSEIELEVVLGDLFWYAQEKYYHEFGLIVLYIMFAPEIPNEVFVPFYDFYLLVQDLNTYFAKYKINYVTIDLSILDFEKIFSSHNNNIKAIGYYIYEYNYLSVWLGGILLLLALIGSIILGKKNK